MTLLFFFFQKSYFLCGWLSCRCCLKSRLKPALITVFLSSKTYDLVFLSALLNGGFFCLSLVLFLFLKALLRS